MFDGDDFEEANKERDTGYSGGGQWRGTCHNTEEVLKRISAATYVATCADHVAFTDTLQRHKEDTSLLQHMADCYEALFANKLTRTSASIAFIHPANKFKCIHALHKNINTVAMLTHDALLRSFRKGMYGTCHNKVSDQRPCARIRKWAFENTGKGVGKNRNGRLTETCIGVTGMGMNRTMAASPTARMLAHTCEWHLRANIVNTYGGANLSHAAYNRVFQMTRAFNSDQLERNTASLLVASGRNFLTPILLTKLPSFDKHQLMGQI